jgi:predicted DNA-binding transcriptional regulator AlpA
VENQADRLISGADVDAMFDVEKTTRYRWIQRGIIPKPIKLAASAAKWSYLECQAALEAIKKLPRHAGPE